MKKLLALVLSLIMILTIVPMSVVSTSAASTQVVPEGYTAVRTVLDLYKVRYNLAGNYILMNDIDLTEATAEGGDYDYGGNGWNPIGSDDVYGKSGAFTGIFDGNGYTIKGMRINVTTLPSGTGSALYLGLFANNAGTIKNLQVKGAIQTVMSRVAYTGGVAAYNKGTVIGCSSGVDINVNPYGVLYAGGIVAYNAGEIIECYNKAGIIARAAQNDNRYVGGISGYGIENSLIENCYNAGYINAKAGYYSNYNIYYSYAYAAGIQGYSKGSSSSNSARIYNCYNVGTVIANAAGGSSYYKKYAITYIYSYTTVQNCYYLTGSGDSCTGATELTPEQTLIQASYNGFDFNNVWKHNANAIYEYPQLISNIQDDRDLVSAEIYSLPNKTTFTKWDDFEVDGCVLKFTFTNADTEYVTVTKDMVTGYDMNKVGVQTLTIASNRRTLTYDITILEKKFIPIYTAFDLYKVRYDLTANYILMNDIDLTEATAEGGDYDYGGNGWNPIGSDDVYGKSGAFTGIFDGNGYTIKGMRINVTTLPSGAGSELYLGLFANNAGTIKNLRVEGTIKAKQYTVYAGGIAAINSGVLTECANEIDITTSHSSTYNIYAGGITGKNSGTIKKCYNSAKIHPTNVAQNTNYGSDYYIYAGGISGYGEIGGTIKNCYNIGEVTADYGTYKEYAYAGGIQSYSKGSSSNSSQIYNCYNIGTVTAQAYSKSYYLQYAITYIYSYTTVQNCYYLTGSGDSCTGATSLSAALLKEPSVLNGFDFDTVWTMAGEPDYKYPELQSFPVNGKIGISGDVAYLSTVVPNLGEVYGEGDTYTCEWFVDGVAVSDTETYTLKTTDIGKKLKLKVTGTDDYNKGILYSNEHPVSKAIQTAIPVAPTVASLDDKKLEITTVSTQEYSIDNRNWQSGGVFTNLDPNKEYTIYSRILENDLYLLGNSTPVLTVTTDRRPLTGSVNIVGTTAFGDTLTADVSAVGPDAKVTYRYEWKRGNEVVGTNKTYTIVKEDIDKTLTLYVIGGDDYIGTLSSAPVTATKASVQVPNAPVIENKTNNSVKLVETAGLEYSKDKVNWQDSALFKGLSPNTEYTFYQRVKETETEFSSKSSNGTKVATLKNTIVAPDKPVVENITNNTVTLKNISGYEYSLDGVVWQTSNIFSGLLPNTEYYFCQRVAETETDYASAQSEYAIVITLKNTVATPNAPEVKSATDCSVVLKATVGYEYSKDGTTWQESNVFNNLEPLTTYTFYQRVAETETDYASEKSDSISFKVKFISSAPSAPVLIEVTNNRIVVETKNDYQYSIDGANWRRQGIFTGLNPNTTYAVYCRMPENDTYYASQTSNPLNVTTLKNTVNTPGAPLLLSKNANSVTLVAVTGYEYSKNGTTWQNSNIFSGLSPNTEYTFYQRVKETDTDYVSGVSVGLTVTTLKNTVAKPSIPTLSQKTANSVTLTAKSGYEYSIDGAVWQTSNVFTGLLPNTKYAFYQRVAETNIAYASPSSVALMVTTLKNTPAIPEAPTIQSKTDTSVTLVAINGYEYSKNGTTWQSSNVFTGLSPDTSYNFYQRVAETNIDYASAKSDALKVTTYKICEVDPSLHSYNNSCDADCNRCGAVRTPGEHEYNNDCDTTCNICLEVRTVGAHVYTNDCDTTCNICDTTRSISHKFTKKTTVKATLSKNGYILTECSVCGVEESKTTIYYAKTFKLSTTTYSYNKKVKTPSVSVKDAAGKTLKKDTDYTVTYASGRKNVGTYKVVIKMKGKYSGSKTLTFSIKPTTKTSVELLVGATKSTSAKSNKSITYKSSNKKVATVSSKGVITAKAAGTATISVTSNKITQKIKVTVKKPYVKISGTSSMLLKKSVKLKATSNTSAKVKWSSSNKKIATVSSSGKVTGQKAGTATIYAKITYKGKTYTGKYTVKVKKPYLTKTSATIDKGKTYQISVNGGSGTITYTSSNKKVATVSSKGVVKGVGKGNATITVKRNGYSMKFTVKVNVNSDKEILAAYAELILKNAALKNPSSYKLNNYIYRKSGSSYTVYVWYSAANGFGGMIDGWAMAQFDTEKSSIGYSVPYKNKYIIVYTDWGRPGTFDGYIDADAVEEEYDKIGTINYYRPSI